MQRTAAIILGHSHLSSVVNNLFHRKSEADGSRGVIEYYIFDTIRLGSDFQFSVPDNRGGYVLNPRVRSMVEERLPDRKYLWISMFGGNAHNALTLLEHPRPFDFILPENTNLPWIPSTELIPVAYVERFLARMAEVYILNMSCLRNAVAEDVIHIESPPPNGDDQYVLEHLEGYFKDQSADPRIAPRVLRYKLWKLHSALIRNACIANNITFLDAPRDTCDVDGFLVPAGYSGDSTHAGPWYGGKILQQIESRYNLAYDGWNWLY